MLKSFDIYYYTRIYNFVIIIEIYSATLPSLSARFLERHWNLGYASVLLELN
jgi:hypothetical protein